jgi:hypothetical protein
MNCRLQLRHRGFVRAAVLTIAGSASSSAFAGFDDIEGAIMMDDGAYLGTVLEVWAFGAVFPSSPHVYGTTETVDAFNNVGGPIQLDSTQTPTTGWGYALNADLTDSMIRIVPGFEEFDRLTVQLNVEVPGTTTPIADYEVRYDGQVIEVEDIGELKSMKLSNIAFRFSFEEYLDPAGFLSGVLTVQWNQVPGPGALALLGVAGVALKRRRRT